MRRLDLGNQSVPGSIVRLFLILCPALIIGALLGGLLLISNRALALTPHAGILVFVVAGLTAGVVTGLLIAPPIFLLQPMVTAAVIDVAVLTALGIYALAHAAAATASTIAWIELPVPLLVGSALQLVITRVVWTLTDRGR